MNTVDCPLHGPNKQTFVCGHVMRGLFNQERVGFFWSRNEPEASRPDAWCRECEARVIETGGKWVAEALEKLDAQVLCGRCYDAAKRFHMGGPFELQRR